MQELQYITNNNNNNTNLKKKSSKLQTQGMRKLENQLKLVLLTKQKNILIPNI